MIKDTKTEKTVQEKKKVNKDFIFAVGRRKESVARVRLYPSPKEEITWGDQKIKKGEVLVNKKTADVYFQSLIAKNLYIEPFRVTNSINIFATTIRVEGGGLSSQLDAAVHGIARALSAYDSEKFRRILKSKGFLTRDARVRQRRKVGMGGKSRRKRQSPKR